jgi:hypothetical protein
MHMGSELKRAPQGIDKETVDFSPNIPIKPSIMTASVIQIIKVHL